jgi:hypothetical protein
MFHHPKRGLVTWYRWNMKVGIHHHRNNITIANDDQVKVLKFKILIPIHVKMKLWLWWFFKNEAFYFDL